MAILPSLVELRDRKRTTGGLDAYDDFWYSTAGGPTNSGVPVSEKTALKYLTVARCVMLISADLARLPLILYRRMSDGSKIRMVDHPLYDILHSSPNPETNSFQWRESGNGHVELWGNHYGSIERNKYSGDIKHIWQIDNPGAVTVKRDSAGRIYYEWYSRTYKRGEAPVLNDIGEEYLGGATKIRRFKKDVFHVPGFGFNGLIGLSVIAMIRESVGLGLANDEFAARYFGQGMNIGGIMSLSHDLGDQEEEYKKKLKKEFAGLNKSHGVVITQNDETYTQLKMPLRDAQFLEGREFQKAEIAGFFGVPGHKVGIYKTNINRNNTEQENQGYLDSCLIHRITRYETSISQQLLTKKDRQFGLFAEFNVAGLLRADAKARSEYYNKIFQVAGISPNEIRAKENMNPDPNPVADEKFIMLNMIPLNMAGDLAEPKKPEEKAQRAIEYRGVIIRDRIARQYYPLFVRAAEKIVNLEANAIKKKVDKFRKQRAKADMEKWLDDFYRNMPAKIKQEIGPVFKSFSGAIITASIEEIGADPDKVDLEKFTADYIDTYSLRHASGSHGQMVALLEGELEDLSERADEWSETRPEKIADREIVQASSAMFQAVAFSVGLGTYWRIRGAKTCPYCTELNGRRVRSGESFVNEGDELNPAGGTGPMKFRGMKAHPQLHQGCDCYLSAG